MRTTIYLLVNMYKYILIYSVPYYIQSNVFKSILNMSYVNQVGRWGWNAPNT